MDIPVEFKSVITLVDSINAIIDGQKGSLCLKYNEYTSDMLVSEVKLVFNDSIYGFDRVVMQYTSITGDINSDSKSLTAMSKFLMLKITKLMLVKKTFEEFL